MKKLTKNDKIALYRAMVKIRRVEERIMDLFSDGKIPGFIHVSIGQEAAAAAVTHHMAKGDRLSTTHRGHGHALARGIDLKRFMAEIFGKSEGFCRGRSGSMHMADASIGLLGANGIVGGGIPIAAGAAFASKYRSDGGVTVCFFGDGATSEGTFHETMNLAAVLQLPLIFVCENNGWAQFTAANRQMCIGDVATRAEGYGVPGETVDNEAVKIFRAAGRAFERARAGRGPTLLEIRSLRWFGHYVGDQQKYRAPEDVEKARQKDCLAQYERTLAKEKILTKDDFGRIREEIDAEIAAAVEFAENCPAPAPQDIFADVYAS